MPEIRLSKDLQRAIQRSFDEAQMRRHAQITLAHLFASLLEDARTRRALEACGARVDRLVEDVAVLVDAAAHLEPGRGAEDGDGEATTPNAPPRRPAPRPSVEVERVLQHAAIHVLTTEQSTIEAPSVVVQMFKELDSPVVQLLESEGVTSFALKQYLSHGIEDEEADDTQRFRPGKQGEEEDGAEGAQKAPDPLEAFTTELVAEAAAGRIDPLIGRGSEVDRLVHVLARRRKNNPVLVGDPGVGKTAIVEGLARRIHEGKVPSLLEGAKVYALDMGALVAGTKFRGQFEERLKGVMRRIAEVDRAILFIDEIHTIVGAGAVQGGTMDAANLLKPSLASGKMRCIGSTTFEEFKASFDRDRALSRRFQRIEVNEPSEADAIAILTGLRPKYEEHHGVRYDDDAIALAVKLSVLHLRERLLPDKAIDVLDEAGSMVRLRGEADARVSAKDIEEVVSKMAKVPPKTVSADDKGHLRTLDKDLARAIFGQDEAIKTLVSAIKLSRAGLRSADKPVGSFLFTGPTGVGKTELAKELARHLGVALHRFDMSEYSERHTVSRLIGAPPGYVGFDQGGLLTDAVRKTPHCLVILDEIEKAHPDLFNILLQVMDHATLTDNTGRKSDFRSVILVLTTNAGAFEASRKWVGFGTVDGVDSSRAKGALERTFPPEFRNRLDAIVAFNGLTPEIIAKVAEKEVDALRRQLAERAVTLELEASALAYLAEHGYDAQLGARPMARLVERALKKPLADALLFGALSKGGVAKARAVDGAIVFDFTAA